MARRGSWPVSSARPSVTCSADAGVTLLRARCCADASAHLIWSASNSCTEEVAMYSVPGQPSGAIARPPTNLSQVCCIMQPAGVTMDPSDDNKTIPAVLHGTHAAQTCLCLCLWQAGLLPGGKPGRQASTWSLDSAGSSAGCRLYVQLQPCVMVQRASFRPWVRHSRLAGMQCCIRCSAHCLVHHQAKVASATSWVRSL
jgi:hypothetical protein